MSRDLIVFEVARKISCSQWNFTNKEVRCVVNQIKSNIVGIVDQRRISKGECLWIHSDDHNILKLKVVVKGKGNNVLREFVIKIDVNNIIVPEEEEEEFGCI